MNEYKKYYENLFNEKKLIEKIKKTRNENDLYYEDEFYNTKIILFLVESNYGQYIPTRLFEMSGYKSNLELYDCIEDELLYFEIAIDNYMNENLREYLLENEQLYLGY